MKKALFSTIFALLISSAQACWYSKSNYTDYIYSVNDNAVMSVSESNGTATYTVTNNKTVDFPLTVSMKLVSNVEIDLNGLDKTSTASEILRGKLQYRVLPSGDWVTVQEYTTPTGTIAKESKPATYFGQNNIWPKGCKAGDVIMIRLYITDGMWQSGTLVSKCGDKLTTVTTEFGSKTTLPNSFQYAMDGTSVLAYDFGGNWYPHLCVTVIYSGNDRPIR